MALLEWWNIIFFLPLLVGLLLALVIAVSGVGFDMADSSEAESDSSHLEGAGESPHGDVPSDTHANPSDANHSELKVDNPFNVAFLQFLSFFGLGRGVPLTVMLPIFFVIWGGVGLILNGLFKSLSPFVYAPISIVISFGVASVAARAVANLISHLLKTKKSSLMNHEFVGLQGQAIYTITPQGGVAHVKDPYGNIHRLVCRSYEGVEIAAGTTILVSEYVVGKGFYYVILVA